MTKKKKKVGEIAPELAAKADNKHTVVDQARENLTDYEQHVKDCAERGLKEYNTDFFVVVLTKAERMFGLPSIEEVYDVQEKLVKTIVRNYTNVHRMYYLHRLSCPTPEYDQTVYQYIYKKDALKYLWTVPDKETCKVYLENAPYIPFEEKQLLQFVMDFNDGTLDRLCRSLNKEAGTGQYLENKLILENPYAKS